MWLLMRGAVNNKCFSGWDNEKSKVISSRAENDVTTCSQPKTGTSPVTSSNQYSESLGPVFTNRIKSCRGLSYWERLEKLDLFSLQRRRDRYVILHMRKIIHDQVPNDISVETYQNDRLDIRCRIPRLPVICTVFPWFLAKDKNHLKFKTSPKIYDKFITKSKIYEIYDTGVQ